MCVECIVVHKKPREGLNYARQAFDDWCCRRDHHDPPQRCPPKSGALPASRRQHRPQLVRRALPGAAHEAHHPKLAAGAPSKLPTARIVWPGRSDPASAWMFRTDARQAKCVQGLVQDRARRPGRDRDADWKRVDPAAAHRARGARLFGRLRGARSHPTGGFRDGGTRIAARIVCSRARRLGRCCDVAALSSWSAEITRRPSSPLPRRPRRRRGDPASRRCAQPCRGDRAGNRAWRGAPCRGARA